MLGHFQTLLESIVADPEQRLSDFPLLTKAERQQLLLEWNGTKTTFPEEDTEAILLVERYFGISFGPMESLVELSKDEQLALILEQAKSAGLIPAALDVSQARRFVELLRSDLRATQNYGLHLYPGRVTLFKARETLTGTSPDPTFGWSEWASGGVEVHVVPGNHANLIYKPHVEVLAEKLTVCLNQAPSA